MRRGAGAGATRRARPSGVLVLGARPRQATQWGPAAPRRELPSFNHYSDGQGAWDGAMVGLEECAPAPCEAWEGTGTVSLGYG
ncbi:hypothetical protein WJX81_005223 [Elliptochloris bilobata]|uniref:Uncharacterized protein n=1 Tax=Elliptochloris bilobata TaxID=381761 RepID=A0AAW1QZX7_9CHLO